MFLFIQICDFCSSIRYTFGMFFFNCKTPDRCLTFFQNFQQKLFILLGESCVTNRCKPMNLDHSCSCCCSFTHSWLFVTPWPAACQSSLSFTISWSLLWLMSIESVMPSNYLVLCCLLHILPSIFPSNRIFSNESPLSIRWPKYWIFSFRISPSNDHSYLLTN